MLSPFLAAYHLAFSLNSALFSLPLLFVAVRGAIEVPWWSILIQVTLAYAIEWGLYQCVLRSPRSSPLSLLFHIPVPLRASDAVDFGTSVVASMAFGYLYDTRRPSVGNYHVRYTGAAQALVIVIASVATGDVIKQFWMKNSRPSDSRTSYLFGLSLLVWAIDAAAWFSEETTLGRLLPAVVLVAYTVAISLRFVHH